MVEEALKSQRGRALPVGAVAAIGCAIALVVVVPALVFFRSWLQASDKRLSGLAEGHFSRTLVLQPCQVAEGVYLLGNASPAAVYVVDTGDGLVMVDSGLEAEYDKIVAGLSQLGLDLRQVKTILLTHAHGDHTMGAERFRRETNAKVYIGREDAGPLRDGGPWEAIFSKFEMPGVAVHPTTVDEELVDEQVLTLGEARITAIATPGHTAGSFCYLLQLHDQRILFCGDTVMSLGTVIGTYAAYLPPVYRGSADNYLASLKKLRAFTAPDLVLPGHPESDPEPQDPRLPAGRWAALLDSGIDELEQLISRYARDGEDFLDGTPKQLAEGLFYLGNPNGRAAYAYLAESHAFLFDAARGTAPAEFLEGAWKQLGVAPPPTAALLLTSCAADDVPGLRAFLDATNCPVVASPAGIAAVRTCGARQLVSTEDMASIRWEGLTAIAVPGLDDTAVAYRFQIGSSRVLVSGEMPIEEDAAIFLRNRSPDGPLRAELFMSSLQELSNWPPHLWLSARPAYGRNANLYEEDWPRVLLSNQLLLRQLRAGRPH